jgi:hypothetical protein
LYPFVPLSLPLRFSLAGLGGFLFISLVVAVRCSGAVNGEHVRNTWESVLLTCLGPRDIIRGKLRGVLQGVLPYLLAIAVPLLVAVLPSGYLAFGAAVYGLAIAGLLLYLLGAVGIYYSAGCRSPWVSLAKTLVVGYGLLAMTLIGVAAMAALLSVVLVVLYHPYLSSLGRWGDGDVEFLACFAAFSSLLAACLVRGAASELLSRAEALISPTAWPPARPTARQPSSAADRTGAADSAACVATPTGVP